MKVTTFSALALTTLVLCGAAGVALQPGPPEPPEAEPIASLPPTPEDPPGILAKLVPASSSFESGETLHVSGRLGHATMAAGRTTETFVHLDLTTAADLEAASAPPVNLSIVMDRSRSMRGQRMQNAMAAARGMIQRLREGDTVSVVAYNTQGTVLVPPTTITADNRNDLVLGLRDIESRGHTCISCGVDKGLEQLERRRGAVNRMLLLSDGQANTGIRDEAGFRDLAAKARERGVAISSLGVDVDYDERLMLAVAQASNGRHYFVRDASELPRVFDDEFRSLSQTVASGVEALIELAPGVEVAQVFDRAFSRRGDTLVVPFGTFAVGDKKSLLMKVRVSRSAAGLRDVADVSVHYSDLTQAGGVASECDGELVAKMTEDASSVSPLDPLVETRLARAETSAALRAANAEFASGNLAAARSTLQATRGRINKRRSASRRRARKKDHGRVDQDFNQQFDALDGAARNFEEAEQANPFNAPASAAGKASIKQNAAARDPFDL